MRLRAWLAEILTHALKTINQDIGGSIQMSHGNDEFTEGMNIIIIHSNSLAAPAIPNRAQKANQMPRRNMLVPLRFVSSQQKKTGNNADENEQLCTTMQSSDIEKQ